MQESIQLALDSAPFLLKGAILTLQLSLGGMALGLILGFLLALMRLSHSGRCRGCRVFTYHCSAARR